MPLTLLVRSGGSPTGTRPSTPSPSLTLDAPLVVIGRGEQCDVRLPDPSVSHRHATVRQRGAEYVLVDEGSANGTFIGGFRIGTQAPRVLRHGDLVRIGRVWLEVRFDRTVPPLQSSMATKELALALVARALDAQGEAAGARLVVTSGPDAGKDLALSEPGRAYVIGRGAGVELRLSDDDASRRHVQVVRRAEQVLARDLGSKNGATIGAEPLSTERDRVWRPGEELHLGANAIVYEHRAVEALLELEGAPDEVLAPDEPIAPPELVKTPEPPVGTDPDSAEGALASGEAPSARPGESMAPPSPEGAPRGSKSPPPPARGGWSSTDFLVVALAVGVLALSVLGLVWLFRG